MQSGEQTGYEGGRGDCHIEGEKGCLVQITNLGKADGLPPVDWAAVAEKLDAGSAPAPDG